MHPASLWERQGHGRDRAVGEAATCKIAAAFQTGRCGAAQRPANRDATGLTQIEWAFGDAETKLPVGLTRPAHWTKPDTEATPPS
jgi:hypothetical protein